MTDRMSFDITKGEDWNDLLPQVLSDDGAPLDLTGKTLRLYIRPTFDFSSAIAILSSPGDISFVDAAGGWARIAVPRSSVAAFPTGTWDQFLILEHGGTRRELSHGAITVRARATAT